MKKTLEQHEHMIDDHQVKLDSIQQNLIDIKVRLGIKDKTNGQIVKYYDDMVKSQEDERSERKEQDALLRNDIRELSNRLWMLTTGVILMVLLEIGLFIVQMKL